MKYFKNLYQSLKNKLDNLIEEIKVEKNINYKMTNIEKNCDEELKKNEEIKKEIEDSKTILKELKTNVKNLNEILKDIEPLPELNKDIFTLVYSDDHPGAMFQMFNDARVILEKRVHLLDITKELEQEILNLPLNVNFFNIVPFKTKYAPIYLDHYLKMDYFVPDIAILDIVFGNVYLENEKIKSLDGIDIGKKILDKNPKALILFYTGCNLEENSLEGKKLEKLIEDYNKDKKRIFVIDKDINDDNRIGSFVEIFNALIKMNPEKLENLSKRIVHVNCRD